MVAIPPRINAFTRLERITQTYKTLRSRIFSGYYFPRQRLVESSLCKDLGVKRAVLREILKHLAVEGMVVMEPFKGCSVADVSMHDALETYQIEAALEGFAAYLAIAHLDKKEVQELEMLIDESSQIDPNEVEQWVAYNRKIHRLINTSCGNRKLIHLIKKNVQFSNYWFMVLSTPGEIPKRNEEHKTILAAIKRKDGSKAQELVQKHIMDAAESIRMRLHKTLPDSKSKQTESTKTRLGNPEPRAATKGSHRFSK
jgi:DNA-binding GntR family transcriptional regulator